jgi:GAF domain-containing protein
VTLQPQEKTRWKGVLLALCGIATVVTFLVAADIFGLGGRPWYGFWDTNIPTAGPYVSVIAKPVPGGAAARAGLREGDFIDLREQDEAARIAVLYQLMATQPTHLIVKRGTTRIPIDVTGSTIWEGAPVWKIATMASVTISSVFFVACAALIAVRRSAKRDARLLALVLLCIVGGQLNPDFFVVPSAALRLVLLALCQACYTGAFLLLIRLSLGFGTRSAWRTAVGTLASAATLAYLFAYLAVTLGIHTLWIDPLPFTFRIGYINLIVSFVASVLLVLAAAAAVSTTPATERPRAAWTLLPIPIALLTQTVFWAFGSFAQSWYVLIACAALSDATWLAGAWAVTYALLKRRVLDVEFVLSRTLVVGAVSAIVVGSFVLLEWLLGTVMAGVSHATGLIANAGLALVLGLSLNPIQRRVDAFIERLLFHKRHENERGLLDFSKEAAYVTDSAALLDLAIAKLQNHTDARSGAILLIDQNAYVPARAFGSDRVRPATENDPLILALKTWHKPADPHHYSSTVEGALALPMLARGRLIGVTALGERAGGEAYAPDEVEALAQFAHGVGTALDMLSLRSDDAIAELRQALAAMAAAIATLGEETASLTRSIAG